MTCGCTLDPTAFEPASGGTVNTLWWKLSAAGAVALLIIVLMYMLFTKEG
nr:hypothetical protein MSRaV_49L [Micropterus salmoides ranavirus]WHA35642.1 hypothetical protein SCRaV_49L [Siniperca chuatsi ranavirus]